MMVRSGAAWVPNGKAKTAMWGSVLLVEEEDMVGLILLWLDKVDYNLVEYMVHALALLIGYI